MSTREERLVVLARASRVWPNRNAENITPGLIELCHDWIKPGFVMAEIGCFAGVSTAVFANFAATVHAVDPWALASERGYSEISVDMLNAAERRFADMAKEYPNIVRHHGFSVEVAAEFSDGLLDAIYIDGAHDVEAFKSDVRAWRSKLKIGGLLMGHDSGIVSGSFAVLGLPTEVKSYSESSWVMKL